MSDGTPPKLSGLLSFPTGVSDMVKNIGSVVPTALIGTHPMRNVPGTAAAVPATSSAAPASAAAQPASAAAQPIIPGWPPLQSGSSQYFLYDTPQMLQAYLDSHKPSSNLYLDAQMDVLLAKPRLDYSLFKDIKFPPVKYLSLQGIKKLESLKYFKFPDSLTELVVRYTGINSLVGVKFPPNLIRLRIDANQIEFLDGVEFPFSLQKLDLTNNKIKSLNGVTFPSNLTELQLSNNNITSLIGAHFPPNLVRLTLRGNPISSLKGIIDPSPNVIQLLGESLPMQVNYFREKTASKAARQSQKAELHKISDLSQQSMRNQLNAVTSFLHDGMAARAMEHNEQAKSRMGNKIFVRMVNDMLYYVPFSPTMTVQDVLDYLNNNYYVSALIPNHGAMSLMVGSTQLDEPLQRLADRNIQNESTLHAVGKMIHLQGGGTRRSSSNQRRSRRRRNKSIKKRT